MSTIGPRPAGLRPLALRLAGLEPLLCLAALPPLVFRERFGLQAQGLALAWLASLWLLRRLARGHWSRRSLLDAPALALLFTLPGAIAVAQLPDASISRALSLLFAMALAVALANMPDRPHAAWLTATGLLLAGLALVPVGLISVDWLDKYAIFDAWLARLPRRLGPVPHPVLEQYGPAEGLGVHPNSVAGLLALFLPLALACLLWSGRPSRGAPGDPPLAAPPWIRPLCLAFLITGGPLMLLTQSRGAWLATALATGLMLLARRRLAFRLVAGSMAAGGLAICLLLLTAPARLEALLARFGGGAAASLASRFDLWRESLALLAVSPETGIGLGNFALLHGQRPEYAGGFIYQGFPHAHNLYLQAALDFGLPGLVALIGLAAALALGARRAYRHLGGTPLAAPLLGLSFGLLAHGLHGMVDAISLGSKLGFVPWAFAGALAGLRSGAGRWVRAAEADRRPAAGPPPSPKPGPTITSEPPQTSQVGASERGDGLRSAVTSYAPAADVKPS